MKFVMRFILSIGRKRPVAVYTGEMMNELFATVDRHLWYWGLLS
jgi:hypothetical protein